MSVSDPLIRDLKGSAVHFLSASQPVTDDCAAVQSFCMALECVLQRGLLVRINTFGSWKDTEPWSWLEKLAQNKYGAMYLYQLSVEKAKKSVKVKTNVGRTRLLIRLCLNNRCLHVPFQLLLESGLFKAAYSEESVLGSEILSQILLSVVLLPGRLQFKLDTDNARFLDDSWVLPRTQRLTFVPADRLGVSLTFVDGKAIAVEVLADSIASEDNQIEVGDVVDELNSVVIVAGLQGCLGQILKKCGHQPITAYVIKARDNQELYSPLVPLLRKAGLNPKELIDDPLDETNKKVGTMLYMGCVLTGDRGDVREIRRAINQLIQEQHETVRVALDCHDMGITVTKLDDNMIFLKHSYMTISSCGCTVHVPNYFAYIVEDNSMAPDNRFVCHIFHTENQELLDNTLTSIGQGFKRTHFAV